MSNEASVAGRANSVDLNSCTGTQTQSPARKTRTLCSSRESQDAPLMTSPKLWQKTTISHLAEECFWIGGSVVATPKWRLGQMAERCVCDMQAGTKMTKLKGTSKTLVRLFYLDEHRSCIRWTPSRKHDKAKITIDSIHEVCEGKKNTVFHHFTSRDFDQNHCFSIYHGDRMESLDLVATTSEEVRTWTVGLRYLMAGITNEDSLAKRRRTRDQWLRQTFSAADKNSDGNLSIGEILQLLHKLNVNLPQQKVRQLFQDADTDDDQGRLAFEEFCTFYKKISTRPDLYVIMLSYSHQKEHMGIDDLICFLTNEQKMTNVSREYCQMIVSQFEPCPENQAHVVLGIDGFTNYMRSPEGDIFNPDHYQVTQDMTHPLTSYYIASSHNTYLSGGQLLSQSRADMYAYVLQTGCRCVEVDCWDGPDGEPIVHHGYTLTSKILFKDVVEAINKYAFAKSQYPVIISIENHCSVPQQKKMAQYLTEVLQDKIDLSKMDINESRMPSPEALKGKILVKGKKLPADTDPDAEEGDLSDEDAGEEDELEEEQVHQEGRARGTDTGVKTKKPSWNCISFRSKKRKRVKTRSMLQDSDVQQVAPSNNQDRVINYGKRKKTLRLSKALSDLVKYTKSVRVHDIETQAYTCNWQVSSLNESITNEILRFKPGQLVSFNQRQLLRIYPSSYRLDSSNFNPQPFWNAGCHLVSLNYQTEGRMLQLNRAKFAANGNCGYVLKPKCMCKGAFNPMLTDPLPGHRKTQLVIKIISGQQLPKPNNSMLGDRGEIIDPFVEVEIIGLPSDCQKDQTRIVDDNGFNPMWEETLVFTLHMPKIALVRFMVWDDDPIGRDFIGQRTIALTSMMPGYRHVYLEGMEEASIFVHVAINEIPAKVGLRFGHKSSNAVKQLVQKNIRHTFEDSKKKFTTNLLRKGGTWLGHSKAKHDSTESYTQEEDFLNRCYHDDLGLQGVGASPQVQDLPSGLHRETHSEPLRRAHRVCFQDPEETLGVTRSCLSASDCGIAGKASNYIAAWTDPRMSGDLSITCKSGQTRLRWQEDFKTSDLSPIAQQGSTESGSVAKDSAPQPPDWYYLSRQSSTAEITSEDSDSECERYKLVLHQDPDPSGRCEQILAPMPTCCTKVCSPQKMKKHKPQEYDQKVERYAEHRATIRRAERSEVTSLPAGFGFRGPAELQAKLSNQQPGIPAATALSRRDLQHQGSRARAPSLFERQRSLSVTQCLFSPTNHPHNFRRHVAWGTHITQPAWALVPVGNPVPNNRGGFTESSSSRQDSLDSLVLSTLPSRFPGDQTAGTLQRELSALFVQKMVEIRCHSPLLFNDASSV